MTEMDLAKRRPTDAWDSLMRASLAGDEQAYKTLLGQLSIAFRKQVSNRLARYATGNSDCEDIVQEALLAIHLKRDTWDPTRPFAPWANAVLAHKFADRARSARARSFEPIDESFDLADESVVDPGVAGDLDRLMQRLDAPQRRIVAAMSLEGRSAIEVARETGSTEGAVRVALHRALKRLSALTLKDRE